MSDMDGEPAALARYECKYLVPDPLVVGLRRALRPFLQPDPHALRSSGNYPVCSLYLDSSDLRLLDMGLRGWSERFKLRARSYSDDAREPVYLEIKRRRDGIVEKRRLRVERPLAQDYLRARGSAGELVPRSSALAFSEFGRLAQVHAARPMLRIKYWREAHESRAGEPLRITFDTRIEYAWCRAGELALEPGPWSSLALGGTVLEIKFTNVYPAWVRDLVARFELERRSLSKYALAMERALAEQPAGARLAGGTARLEV